MCTLLKVKWSCVTWSECKQKQHWILYSFFSFTQFTTFSLIRGFASGLHFPHALFILLQHPFGSKWKGKAHCRIFARMIKQLSVWTKFNRGWRDTNTNMYVRTYVSNSSWDYYLWITCISREECVLKTFVVWLMVLF